MKNQPTAFTRDDEDLSSTFGFMILFFLGAFTVAALIICGAIWLIRSVVGL